MKHDYPVYGTQGGGLARQSGNGFIFVEDPAPGTGLKAGDEVPAEWSVAPANTAAHAVEARRDEPDEFVSSSNFE